MSNPASSVQVASELSLTIQDGKVTASSRDVAKRFGKVHRDVVRAIDNLDCSAEFRLRNFAQLNFNHHGNKYLYYEMTRDGFSFLCMGFTGKEAAVWKEKYIEAFNLMEEQLREQYHRQTAPVSRPDISWEEYAGLLRDKITLLELQQPKRRRAPRPFTEEDQEEIRRLSALGYSQREICEAVDRSSALVSMTLRNRGEA